MFAPLQDDIILVGDNGGAICWKGESLYLSEMDVADWHTLAGQARSAGHAAVLCGLETACRSSSRPLDILHGVTPRQRAGETSRAKYSARSAYRGYSRKYN